MNLARTSIRLYQFILHESLFETANTLYSDGWRLQQDNAPADSLEERKIESLASRNVHVIDWPVNSPDLMPIENLWSWMKREVGKKRNQRTRQNWKLGY